MAYGSCTSVTRLSAALVFVGLQGGGARNEALDGRGRMEVQAMAHIA